MATGLLRSWPRLPRPPAPQVRPTSFGVVDDHTMFVAFEGRATPHTPFFKVCPAVRRPAACRQQTSSWMQPGRSARLDGGAPSVAGMLLARVRATACGLCGRRAASPACLLASAVAGRGPVLLQP